MLLSDLCTLSHHIAHCLIVKPDFTVIVFNRKARFYVHCLIVKPDFPCELCRLHNSSFAQHIELKFCSSLKKINTNTN